MNKRRQLWYDSLGPATEEVRNKYCKNYCKNINTVI